MAGKQENSGPLALAQPTEEGPPNWRFVARECCAVCEWYIESNSRWGCRFLLDWREHDQAHDKAAACFMICDRYQLTKWVKEP